MAFTSTSSTGASISPAMPTTRPSRRACAFSDTERITRETDWSRLPAHRIEPGPLKTVTREEPCDYTENNLERYYPVKTSDGRYDRIYRRYRDLADGIGNLTFIGRCGTYQYLDMHQVINQSLAGAREWIARNA